MTPQLTECDLCRHGCGQKGVVEYSTIRQLAHVAVVEPDIGVVAV